MGNCCASDTTDSSYPEYPPAPPPDTIIYIDGREGAQIMDLIILVIENSRSDQIFLQFRWVSRTGGRPLPETAVKGGRDNDGSDIYIGRAFHEGDMIPAKVIPDKSIAYVCWNGEEHAKHEFEVLCQGEFAWEFCSDGAIPDNAVVAGQTADGEPLYVGRVLHSGSQTIGKIQQSHGCLYIPYDGEELSFKDYEVLVLN